MKLNIKDINEYNGIIAEYLGLEKNPDGSNTYCEVISEDEEGNITEIGEYFEMDFHKSYEKLFTLVDLLEQDGRKKIEFVFGTDFCQILDKDWYVKMQSEDGAAQPIVLIKDVDRKTAIFMAIGEYLKMVLYDEFYSEDEEDEELSEIDKYIKDNYGSDEDYDDEDYEEDDDDFEANF
jgi:hypothetical protein